MADTATTSNAIEELKQQGANILQELIAFVEGVLLGQQEKISYKIPDVKETQTFTLFGKSWTITEEVVNGNFVIEATPNS